VYKPNSIYKNRRYCHDHQSRWLIVSRFTGKTILGQI